MTGCRVADTNDHCLSCLASTRIAAQRLTCGALRPYTADLAPVVSMSLWQTANLPGEFQPFLMVSLQARVAGYVEKVLVDRGSAVPS
jgi:hypothetical protein